jgi:hypothetical protein
MRRSERGERRCPAPSWLPAAQNGGRRGGRSWRGRAQHGVGDVASPVGADPVRIRGVYRSRRHISRPLGSWIRLPDVVQYSPAKEWRPNTSVERADVAKLVMFRLVHEAQLDYVRRAHAVMTDDGWLAEVRTWPHDEITIEAVRSVLFPMKVATYRQQEMSHAV